MTLIFSLECELLARAQHLFDLGLFQRARVVLTRLLTLDETSNAIRVEGWRLFGLLEVAAGRFQRARSHFAAALGYAPDRADLYHQFALAVEADPEAEPRRAYKAARKAAELAPTVAEYWVTFGQLALRIRRRRVARRAFRQAVKLVPTQENVLRELVEGLSHLGRYRLAKKALVSARLQKPSAFGLLQLWDQFRYEQARRQQQASAQPQKTVLPFVQTGEKTRRDLGANFTAHLFQFRNQRGQQKSR